MNLTDAKNKVIADIESLEMLIATPCLEKCNYIVQSDIYTVGTDNNGVVKVDIFNSFPTQFTFEAATKLLTFNASNNKGKLVWQLVKAHDYHVAKLTELKSTLELLSDVA